MADSPRKRYARSSRSPSPYRGRPKSRSRSPAARSQSGSPLPDPRSQVRSRSRSPEREPAAVNHGNTLYVTGLSSKVTDRELKDYFNKEGKVVSCHVVLEPHTRVSRGFAFITMDTVEDAERCIKYLNQSEMQGRHITVEKSRRGRPRTPTPGSYLGHRYERREQQRGGRFRRGGYGREEYYGNSYRRSPPPMYSSYRETRDYPSYRDTRDYSPHRDARDYYEGRGGRGYSPPRSPYGGRARRERSPYSPYRMPERGYGGRRAAGGGYDSADDQNQLKPSIVCCESAMKSRRGRPRTPTPGSYLGHRYERREQQRGGRFRRGGYGREEYYGNSYRRSPPPMYSSYRETRDYPSYRDTRDYSPHRDARDYYEGRGGRGYSPPRSPYGGRARRERSPYSPYRMPERGYGGRRAAGGGYDR